MAGAAVIGAINLLATVAGIGLMIKDAIPNPDPDPSAITIVRIGAASYGIKEVTINMDFKGDFPNLKLYDKRGQLIGESKSGPQIGAGGWREVSVKHKKGMEGVTTDYIYITASGNDAVCINTVGITMPGGDQWGFLGDIGSMCGADWYYSDVTVTNSDSIASEPLVMLNRKSNCIWIDKDHSNKLRFQGFSYHVPSFGTSKDADKGGRAFQYQQHPETICSSRPRYHNIERANNDPNLNLVTIFWPELEYNTDGSDKNLTVVTNNMGKNMDPWVTTRDLHTRPEPNTLQPQCQDSGCNGTATPSAKENNPPTSHNIFANRLIKSESEQHDAHALCESQNTRGWDFVSITQGLYCDMAHKQLWPLCSKKITHSCFDNSVNEMRAGPWGKRDLNGVQIPKKSYEKVTTWGR